ncbi:hypothetical protein [Paenibacillus lupini]|uniref:hypothetical protein n=1 Tax=Paenibacillus lupini TaxID=1450204 RepID=UPI001420AE21|nr:hypothetical protein [Paenibacillus lupini]NIK22285.1 hypothetical protein [Paenibacillus lupini]
MKFIRLGLSLLLLVTFITSISGCTGDKQNKSEVIFYAEDENWIAQYKTNSSQTAKEKVVFNFFYKGSFSELIATKEIVFSYGTRKGNIPKTIHYDEIDKAQFLIEFDGDFIQDIVGNHEEKILVIIKWNNKSETLQLTQYNN